MITPSTFRVHTSRTACRRGEWGDPRNQRWKGGAPPEQRVHPMHGLQKTEGGGGGDQ